MTKKTQIARFLGESSLWMFANLVCVGLPTLAVYIMGTTFGLWSPWKLTLVMIITAVLTSTWGSWSTLIWTRSRLLRAVQQGITTLPGIITMALGGALLYVGVGKLYLALLVMGGGVGMIGAAVALAGGVFTKNEVPNRAQYLLGLLVYPLATTLATGTIAALWYTFTSSSPSGWSSFFSIATLMTSILASALVSTIIPAGMSRVCQEVGAKLS